MRTYRLWLFASVSLILVASAAAHAPVAPAAAPAAPSVVQETITGPEGSASTRTITAHDTFHDTFDAAPSSDIAPPALAGSRGANQYVWIDRNHGNAIAEHVAITGDGAYGVAGWWLNDMRCLLYTSP
ncbi:MAG: hypothetical protein QUU85_11810, partial [Candidatus Eisenbacteria bacterium]|nr:hypothetical protein [Candidatus Eisenbacteria bacterium]